MDVKNTTEIFLHAIITTMEYILGGAYMSIKSISIRIEKERLEKVRYIAKRECRSVNG